jgi:uncharacterized protein YndB with AHSA1/START domain
VEVAAPVERVWALVTDIDLPARFSPEFQGAQWVDGDGPRLGARFVGRNAHAAMGEWETTSWINRLEAMRSFGWAVSDPDEPSATWWFELEEVGPSSVRVTQGGRMGPAPSGLSIAIRAMPEKEERIVERRLEEWARNMTSTLEGIKALAENEE